MFIGDILVARGLVSRSDIAAALELQRSQGGKLGDCLVQLDKVKPADIERVMREAPGSPDSLADIRLSLPALLNLLVKAIASAGDATPSSIGDILKLPPGVVQELIEEADLRHLLTPVGPSGGGGGFTEISYGLSEQGAQRARMAIEQNGYVGPAPVSLEDYRTQVARQRISNERLTRSMVAAAFGDLVVSPDLLSNVGIAANASRPMLLYGPSGNGKTSIGLRVGALFRDVIFIPYCFEVDGQIIKVYDPAVHKRVERQTSGEKEPISLRRENLDERWVACRRPLVILGGELTLDMLKLGSEACGLYEAPPQVKALGGVLMMDDFGRQIVSPTALLNRWIVPLEAQVDYLTLGTGKTFDLPFDELVIFCTNLTPSDLVDPAFLRRIPYKIEVPAPSADEYRRIFQAVCVSRGIQIDDDMVGELIDEISVKNNFPLAGYQPKSIIDQVFAIAKFEGEEPDISREQIRRALRNLYTTEMAEVLGGKRVTAH